MNNGDDEITTLVEFMNNLQQSNNGLVHTLLHGTNGKDTGCMCQTDAMKKIERHGSHVSVYMEDRHISTHLWPCTSIAMLNELGKKCLGYEGLVYKEKDELSRQV